MFELKGILKGKIEDKTYFPEWGSNPWKYYFGTIYLRSFLVQMKTAKSPFEINWPLSNTIFFVNKYFDFTLNMIPKIQRKNMRGTIIGGQQDLGLTLILQNRTRQWQSRQWYVGLTSLKYRVVPLNTVQNFWETTGYHN